MLSCCRVVVESSMRPDRRCCVVVSDVVSVQCDRIVSVIVDVVIAVICRNRQRYCMDVSVCLNRQLHSVHESSVS